MNVSEFARIRRERGDSLDRAIQKFFEEVTFPKIHRQEDWLTYLDETAGAVEIIMKEYSPG